MQGKIVKGIAGFYYIHGQDNELYECKAKGIFRNQKIKPLVGDNVIIDIINNDKKVGNIVDILKRKNELIRPHVANVDMALVIFAVANPAPNLNLLDRFLLIMKKQNVETCICFNKQDIIDKNEALNLKSIYQNAGCKVLFSSVKENIGLDKLRDILKDKTTVLAGPSGVGKSSFINSIYPNANMEVGLVSKKIKRGKHTTRHSELFNIYGQTYIIDTPGFSSLYIDDFEKEELNYYFEEFKQYENNCKFKRCVHINEPNCAVKKAVEDQKISKIRYENYISLYNELKEKKKY